MKKIIYILLIVFFSQPAAYGQKETSWWHFGYKSGLNFNSLSNATAADGTVVADMPEAIVGPLDTREGCFTVSTYDGKLLFSSDGSTVYDKNGNVMTNGTGLFGDFSATQSGIAIPKPGSLTEYYVITVPAMGGTAGSDGLRYSIVDISKTNNGSFGAVTSKNIIIKAGYVYENISAVPNANGKDYWLIHRSDKTFYIYAVTSTGINTTPHFTLASANIFLGGPQGEVIISSDYKKIVSVNWGGKQVISADFNPATGVISNIRTLECPYQTYGGTFSPNGKYIYIGTGFENGGRLYSNTWDNLRSGATLIYLASGFANIRAAMDKRLYGIQCSIVTSAEIPTKNLAVVMNPDDGGSIIKYFPDYLKNTAALGLPTFATGFIRIIPKEQPFACAANRRTYSVEVDLSGGNIPSRLEWNFGDGTPVINQVVSSTQSKYSKVHSYNDAGMYTITITPYKGDGTALSPITMLANIVYCSLKSNNMTRSDLHNSKQMMQ